jgi:hypothetical protein
MVLEPSENHQAIIRPDDLSLCHSEKSIDLEFCDLVFDQLFDRILDRVLNLAKARRPRMTQDALFNEHLGEEMRFSRPAPAFSPLESGRL